MIARFLKFFFGTANQRSLKQLQHIIEKINSFESSFSSLEDHQLALKTEEFRERYRNGESIDSLLPEAFANAREAGKRALGQRHYDVQLVGGLVLHQGKIAEMKTGEGKTLTATLALYLNSLSGKSSQLVTVNDYLAKRDAEWMEPIYRMLGLTVGVLQNNMPDIVRKAMYACDVLYATNSELGFDYLRDNMKFRLEDRVQRDLNYAIVDEVDSILIDEARTPLIISGSTDEEIALYEKVNKIVVKLDSKTDYEVDNREKHVLLTEIGTDKVEAALEINNLYAVENIKFLHHVNQSLKAHVIFKRDVDYVAWKNEVLIVDEFTGRILAGRRYSDGLHQAIEAKEGVEIQQETQTLASITLQNYFRLYKKLAGMTGTAATEAEEFHKIYKLDVVSIPTNQPVMRIDKPDLIFLTERSKFQHIVIDIKERYAKGQPVLIGTVAVETSERLSDELSRNNIPHQVLNAKQHKKEAEIIINAGEAGRITIATNMAGRGTDIKLTKEAKEAGGLYILGTERHESRRIDNQLRGRSGRQGDPGESRFYISLEDSLIRRFGGDTIKRWMERGGMTEDEVIEDSMVSKTIETAQEKVEKQNFEMRKHLIEYDDVLNQQRVVIYKLRQHIIGGGNELINVTKDLIRKFVHHAITSTTQEKTLDSVQRDVIIETIFGTTGVSQTVLVDHVRAERSADVFMDDVSEVLIKRYESLLGEQHIKDSDLSQDDLKHALIEAQKWFMLEVFDQAWRQHIVDLDHIREGIGLRGYGQKTPIIEYKREAFALFGDMVVSITHEIMSRIFKLDMSGFDKSIMEERRISELKEITDALNKHEECESNEKNVTKKLNNKGLRSPKNRNVQ